MSTTVRVAGNLRRKPWHEMLSLRSWIYNPSTRGLIRLLGPCYKTGGVGNSTKAVEQKNPYIEFEPFESRYTKETSKLVSPAHQKTSTHTLAKKATRFIGSLPPGGHRISDYRIPKDPIITLPILHSGERNRYCPAWDSIPTEPSTLHTSDNKKAVR